VLRAQQKQNNNNKQNQKHCSDQAGITQGIEKQKKNTRERPCDRLKKKCKMLNGNEILYNNIYYKCGSSAIDRII